MMKTPLKSIKERKTCKGCGWKTHILNSEGLCYDCVERGVTEAQKAGQSLVSAEELLESAISHLSSITEEKKETEPEEFDDIDDDIEEEAAPTYGEQAETALTILEKLSELQKKVKQLETKPPVAIKPKKKSSPPVGRRRLLRPVGVKRR